MLVTIELWYSLLTLLGLDINGECTATFKDHPVHDMLAYI